MSTATAMRWASCLSERTDLDAALAECRARIAGRLGDAPPDVLFVFATPHFQPQYERLAGRLQEAFAPRRLFGGSALGLVGDGRELEDAGGLSVTAARLPGVELSTFHVTQELLPNEDASPRAWEQLAGADPRTEPDFVLLVDPFTLRADELVRGLDFAFPRASKVGGLVSGARQRGQNVLFIDGHVERAGAIGLVLRGAARLDPLVAQGCRPIGAPLRVTQCKDNSLQAVDGRKPLEVVAALFEAAGERDRQLIRSALFLGLIGDPFKNEPPQAGDFLIRNILGMDPQQGALVVGALLREGQTVQFHVRDAQAADEDLQAVLRRYASALLNEGRGQALAAPPAGALLFSCLGRGRHMYGHADHDTGAFKRHLGDVPLAGFFCNGEIGPVGGTTYVHGFTSCFGVFRAKSEPLAAPPPPPPAAPEA
ncbi:MAG: FIST C-terminal domain-containing protein [Planctomycetota bacterium]|nr:FIST C-terminal domain-containing protein [Planctomycetota bacterium]